LGADFDLKISKIVEAQVDRITDLIVKSHHASSKDLTDDSLNQKALQSSNLSAAE